MTNNLHPSDLSGPACDQLLFLQHDISCHYVDQFCLLPTVPVFGRVVRPQDESYRQFESQWFFTH